MNTRARIEEEIAAGKLGIARDRLHGLLTTYPDDLTIRTRLAEVNWMLGYPAEAGRFWFLDSPLEGHKAEAVEAFIRSCGRDPALILRRLKIRNEMPDLHEEARARLQKLLDETGTKLDSERSPNDDGRTPAWKLRLISIGCAVASILFLVVFSIGLGEIARRIFRW